MYFADRVAFHLVVTINSLFTISPLEGKERPKPEMTRYHDSVIRYGISGREKKCIDW
jgi:hypothetical protein